MKNFSKNLYNFWINFGNRNQYQFRKTSRSQYKQDYLQQFIYAYYTHTLQYSFKIILAFLYFEITNTQVPVNLFLLGTLYIHLLEEHFKLTCF